MGDEFDQYESNDSPSADRRLLLDDRFSKFLNRVQYEYSTLLHTVAVHFRYHRYMRRLANEFLCRNPMKFGVNVRTLIRRMDACAIIKILQLHTSAVGEAMPLKLYRLTKIDSGVAFGLKTCS